ncbi:MAG: DUF1569 domain-containing protein [Phycisphaerae bacterium]
MINTREVTDRRKLKITSIKDIEDDVERIVAADSSGNLRQTGNWTPGQAFGHLAAWINYAYDGYPFKFPWIGRLLIRRFLPKILASDMRPGFRIAKNESGTHGVERISTHEGQRRYTKALHRLKTREPANHDSPVFGKMTDDQRIQLNLRHAELHLSFFHPEAPESNPHQAIADIIHQRGYEHENEEP